MEQARRDNAPMGERVRVLELGFAELKGMLTANAAVLQTTHDAVIQMQARFVEPGSSVQCKFHMKRVEQIETDSKEAMVAFGNKIEANTKEINILERKVYGIFLVASVVWAIVVLLGPIIRNSMGLEPHPDAHPHPVMTK